MAPLAKKVPDPWFKRTTQHRRHQVGYKEYFRKTDFSFLFQAQTVFQKAR